MLLQDMNSNILIYGAYFAKNTMYSHIKLPIMVQTGPSQIGHKNKGEIFNLADKTDSQVSEINTDLIWYVPTTQGCDSTTEGPIIYIWGTQPAVAYRHNKTFIKWLKKKVDFSI